jgi:hypothetical protein
MATSGTPLRNTVLRATKRAPQDEGPSREQKRDDRDRGRLHQLIGCLFHYRNSSDPGHGTWTYAGPDGGISVDDMRSIIEQIMSGNPPYTLFPLKERDTSIAD